MGTARTGEPAMDLREYRFVGVLGRTARTCVGNRRDLLVSTTTTDKELTHSPKQLYDKIEHSIPQLKIMSGE